MNHFLKKIQNKKELIFLVLIFSIFFVIAILSYKDFGIGIDEWDLRRLGFVNLKYIFELFQLSNLDNLDKILSTPKMSEYGDNTHGAIFVLLMSFIEYFLNIVDIQKNYFLRHIVNHFIFLLSVFYFYLIAKERFDHWTYGVIGALFLYLSPRIFAESFYNYKDILFMSLFIIALYYGIKFLKYPTTKNAIIFAFTSALSIDVRIMGIILVPIIIFFIFQRHKINKNVNLIKSVLIFFSFLFVFIYLFWPYLWQNPINNFLQIFVNLSSFNWEGYNLYLGKYILGSNVPWHYVFIWIIITTPFFYLSLFFVGFFKIILKIKTNLFQMDEKYPQKDVWKTDHELIDLIFILLLIIPLFLVISLNSTLYDGWRHLYFIYPLILIISLSGLVLIEEFFFKNKKKVFFLLIVFFLLHITFLMFKTHPHQYVYFNFLAGKNVIHNFDVDYWGISNKQAFEYILKNDKKNKIKIGSATPISLENSLDILSSNDRNKFQVVKNIEADYIINNYRNWFGYTKDQYKIPDNFLIYKQIIINGVKVISIYKRI